MSYKGFSEVQLRRPQRSTFDLSHDKRLSAQMGYLYPVLVQECIPSDHFNGNTDLLVRLAPLLAPIYDQIQVFVHYFFVPNRILWDDWELFITGGETSASQPTTAAPVVPYMNVEEILAVNPLEFTKSRLADYMGVPILADLPDAPNPVDWSLVSLDVLPFMAYNRIWYDYFRDRNFVRDTDTAFEDPLSSGKQDANFTEANLLGFRSRGYKADYFRTSLPWPQRGAETIIPLSVVDYLEVGKVVVAGNIPGATGPISSFAGLLDVAGTPPADGGMNIHNIDTETGQTGTLVNDWRTAYALQVWLERNAVGGNRYTESIQAHFGVRPQDSRLQRSEYIGGGMLNVKISEVVATAWSENADTDSVPQGNMAGHGVSFGSANGFSWFCPEHGFIFGIMSIVNPPSYHQGLPRMFKRRTFLDYPFPTFAKLGEQEVYKWELYASSFQLTGGDEDTDTEFPVFGYQSRYADWKTGRNTSHGDFHDTMLFWTLTDDYGISQNLNESFVTFNPLIEERIFAAPVTDNFWIYLHNRVTVHRPLPYFGTPNTLGFE